MSNQSQQNAGKLSDPQSTPFLIAVIRIPKSGSESLGACTDAAFPNSNYFRIPDTLNLDAQVSSFQALRQARHIALGNFARFGAPLTRTAALDRIDKRARPFDVVTGGHLDFQTLSRRLTLPVKMISVVRNPAARALSEYNYARNGHRKKWLFQRFDAGLMAKVAHRYNFEGYLDFLREHKNVYGNIACKFLGIENTSNIATHTAAHVFHIGRLEDLGSFIQGLRAKTGAPVNFPHLNKTASKTATSFGASESRKLHDLYAHDFELYHWLGRAESQIADRSARRA